MKVLTVWSFQELLTSEPGKELASKADATDGTLGHVGSSIPPLSPFFTRSRSVTCTLCGSHKAPFQQREV